MVFIRIKLKENMIIIGQKEKCYKDKYLLTTILT